MEIKMVTNKQALEIIDKRIPIGLFYLKEEDSYVGIDNSTGHAWVEEFESKDQCINWLENS